MSNKQAADYYNTPFKLQEKVKVRSSICANDFLYGIITEMSKGYSTVTVTINSLEVELRKYPTFTLIKLEPEELI